MRAINKARLDRIVDAISCADGGIKFAQLKGLLEVLDKRAVSGHDPAAEECLKVLEQFDRLIDIAGYSEQQMPKPPKRRTRRR